MRRGILAIVALAAVPVGAAAADDAPPGGPGMAAPAPPGTVIVRYAGGADADQRLAARRSADVERDAGLPVPDTEVVDPKPGVSVDEAVNALERSDHVLYAEPDRVRRADSTPNDPMFGLQWALDNSGQAVNGISGQPGADVGAPTAWDYATTGSPPVPVAVIDSGIDLGHPDLASSLWSNPGEIPGNGRDDDGDGYVDDVHGWDFVKHDAQPLDANGHGTHVAGIIGARGNDGFGVAGVAWQSALMALRVLDAQGGGYVSDAIAAETYAVRKGARVVNLSLSGLDYSQAEHDAIASAPGVLFVAAAGNGGTDDDASARYPCAYDLPNVVCVAATDSADALAGFSNFGASDVALAAPGTNIVSTWPGAGHAILSGTSMAAPYVAGAAALALGAAPSLTPAQLAALLRETADPIDGLSGRVASGGRLDLARLLERVAPPGSTPGGGSGSFGAPSQKVRAPSVPAAPARARDRIPPGLAVSTRGPHTVHALAQGALRLRARCSEACGVRFELRLPRAAARRLHVPAQLATVDGSVPAAGELGRNPRLGAPVARRLAKAGRLGLILSATATDAAGNRRTRSNADLRVRP